MRELITSYLTGLFVFGITLWWLEEWGGWRRWIEVVLWPVSMVVIVYQKLRGLY